MSKVVTIAILLIASFTITSAAYGATTDSSVNETKFNTSKIVRSQTENNAFHNLKVKRLKRLLQSNQIDSEKFFGEIEKMVKRKAAE